MRERSNEREVPRKTNTHAISPVIPAISAALQWGLGSELPKTVWQDPSETPSVEHLGGVAAASDNIS